LIDKAARVASLAPALVNFAGRTPPLSSMLKFAAGAAPKRAVPQFAPVTLQQWFQERGERNVGGPRVVVWPDTFNNYMHADVGVAAVEAIEAAGWHVVMPRGHVCCGRPLYDYGFLDLARRYLVRVLDAVRDEVRAGTPIVGIEPSCLAVFKDELPKLLPNDDDAKRLTDNSYHFPDFFEQYGIAAPQLDRKAIVWGHCHHKATGGMKQELALLRRMGLDVTEVTGGCCGLAGSWGFERGHYDMSIDCGDQGLLQAVRNADPSTLIVADGFSCTTQIEQAETDRRGLHVAQVMRLAASTQPLPEERPERAAPPAPSPSVARRARRVGGIAAAASVAAVASVALGRRLRRSV
jgi:Fe-S oxidoreductase